MLPVPSRGRHGDWARSQVVISDALNLRDAQATIAREFGFDSWKALLTEVEEALRWVPASPSGISRPAFVEAQALGHGFCTDLHVLLALLKPPAPTAATDVLAELGLSYEKVRERLEEWNLRPRHGGRGVSSTPTYHLLVGSAQGIAIGMGASRVSEEHVLLALAFGEHSGESELEMFSVDPASTDGAVSRRDRLGGLIHEHHREAA